MWIALDKDQSLKLVLAERQSIWPAPDGSDAQLIITTDAIVVQEVILATPRVTRLRYTIEKIASAMILGEQPPAPWKETAALNGRAFELMLTERGAMVVPSHGPKLPNRLRSWMATVSEDIRSCWPIPPDDIAAGTKWTAMPAVPGGLPPGTTSAAVKVAYEVLTVADGHADISVKFGLNVMLDGRASGSPRRGEGRGELKVRLERETGVRRAAREGRMELVRTHTRNQIVRSSMRVQRA